LIDGIKPPVPEQRRLVDPAFFDALYKDVQKADLKTNAPSTIAAANQKQLE